MRRTAYRGKLNEVLSLSCPKCSQPLEIHFETNSPQPSGERKGCLKIKCTSCIAGTYWDGLSDAPEWIEAFGHTIQTRPS